MFSLKALFLSTLIRRQIFLEIWHIELIAAKLLTNVDAAAPAPDHQFRHHRNLKSLCASVALPAWLLA